MALSCGTLNEAYQMIRSQYVEQGLKPGRLRSIGFASGWTTVETQENHSGMAFHFNGEHAVYGPLDPAPLVSLQPFVGRNLDALAGHLLCQEGLLFRSACLAALNALSYPFTHPAALEKRGIPLAPDEEMDFLRPEDVVVVVGYGRVLSALHRQGLSFHVCDFRSAHSMRTLVVGEQVTWGPAGVTFHDGKADTASLLATADVVLMTGCTLVNDTLPGLLAQCGQARVKGLFGPSAGLLPEYLLGLGLNYILYDRWQPPLSLAQTLAQGQRRDSWGDSLASVIVKAC